MLIKGGSLFLKQAIVVFFQGLGVGLVFTLDVFRLTFLSYFRGKSKFGSLCLSDLFILFFNVLFALRFVLSILCAVLLDFILSFNLGL